MLKFLPQQESKWGYFDILLNLIVSGYWKENVVAVFGVKIFLSDTTDSAWPDLTLDNYILDQQHFAFIQNACKETS